MSRMFAAIYGSELLQERLDAAEYLRSLHIDYPHKYTLLFVRSTCGKLNYRWVQELREMTNVMRMYAQVERPTFAQLRSIGTTVVTAAGLTVYQRPNTFDLRGTKGYFATEIPRRMNDEKELNERNAYHSGGPRTGNPRVGALQPMTGMRGPPMTPSERRIAGKEAPKTPAGDRIFWNYNSHLGCSETARTRAHQFYNNYEQLSYALKIALLKRYGFKKRNKLSVEQIAHQIKGLRQVALAESERNRTQPGTRGGPNPMADPARRVVKNSPTPTCLAQLDFKDQEDELRRALHQPSAPFGGTTPQDEFSLIVHTTSILPDGEDPFLSESKLLVSKLAEAPGLKFLRGHSPRLSAFVSACVMQDLRRGKGDTRASIERALLTASQGGIDPLKEEANAALGKESRTGGLKADLSTINSVSFSAPRAGGIGSVTDMTPKGRTWPVYDFGDTLPVIADDPSNELYGKTSTDKNKCLLLHIAAAVI